MKTLPMMISKMRTELDRVNAELAARDHALHLAAEEIVHQQDKVARLHKVNTGLVALLKLARKYVLWVAVEGIETTIAPCALKRIDEVLEMAGEAR